MFEIDVYYPATDTTEARTESFDLEIIEIMLVCSILVSSDIIASMAILNFNE